MVPNQHGKQMGGNHASPDSSDIVILAAHSTVTRVTGQYGRWIRVIDRVVYPALGMFVALLLCWSGANLIPTQVWFEARSVEVFDSTVGTAPRMIVDRATHIPLNMDWDVMVYKPVESGYQPMCHVTGNAEYEPTDRLPPDLDLDWWTFPVECDLEPGVYFIRTLWTMRLFGVVERTVRAVSNPFTIHPLEAPDGNDESSINQSGDS